MVEPKVGMPVLFTPSTHEADAAQGQGQLAGIIAKVWGPDMVNIMEIDVNGNPSGRTSVWFVQPGATRDGGYWCTPA